MVNSVFLLTDAMILVVAVWGQYWRDRAKRLQDVIEFMVQDEIDGKEDSERE